MQIAAYSGCPGWSSDVFSGILAGRSFSDGMGLMRNAGRAFRGALHEPSRVAGQPLGKESSRKREKSAQKSKSDQIA